MFQMPLSEIRERFTISEQVMLSWKNQETLHNMKSNRPAGQGASKRSGAPRQEYDDPNINNLPDRFFNKEGELDLSGVKGEEAATVMNKQLQALGLKPMPVFRR